ncbi:MAG TPA: LysR substrate-binding domain-containing protein [Dongiaceae bacterium]|nr:LysR substrate-binding domain-containing protein [Dongiaceae bacterium]
MRKLPPLRALHAFEAVARLGSFAAAAVELGITPTAVSHQIRTLEQFFGQALFRRRPRPLALTGAGEKLYPLLHNGFDALAAAVAALAEQSMRMPLRVTSPNAFASRWLVPRLSSWRRANPAVPLEIIGTDSVLDLRAGAADLAIRYARKPPTDFAAQELFRDTYFAVCSPKLAERYHAGAAVSNILRAPLIHYEWLNRDPEAPTWRQWRAAARSRGIDVQPLERNCDLSFREEIHAIDAAIDGQGIAVCSDIVVGDALKAGMLIKAHPLALPGYSFYAVAMAHHPRTAEIDAFRAWVAMVT